MLALIAAPFVGSFIGTLILRLPAGEPVIAGRSVCASCGRRLRAPELIPIVSWLLLGGKCNGCRARISIFYPAIELGAISVAAWAALESTGVAFLLSCCLGWALLALAVMDWRTLRLADCITLPLIVAGLGAAYVIDRPHLLDHAIGAAAGFLLMVAVARTYRFVRGREGLGLGDAKLLAAGGAWVAWQAVGSILLIGSAAALISVLASLMTRSEITGETPLPFGTFLALAIWIVWLYGPLTSA